MRIPPFLLAAVLASGCATSHTRIDTGPAAGGTPVTGTSYGGARVTVEYPSGSAAPGLAFLAVLGLLVYAEGAAGPAAHGLFDSSRQAPAMDPARRVNEQDCSKPIEVPGANLRCR